MTDKKETKRSPTGDVKRRRGAPRGNRNAFKHGLYSRFITVDDEQVLEAMSKDDALDELALARVRLVNALDEYARARQQGDPDRMESWDASVLRHIDAVTAILNCRGERGEQEGCLWETILDALRAANDAQKVHR